MKDCRKDNTQESAPSSIRAQSATIKPTQRKSNKISLFAGRSAGASDCPRQPMDRQPHPLHLREGSLPTTSVWVGGTTLDCEFVAVAVHGLGCGRSCVCDPRLSAAPPPRPHARLPYPPTRRRCLPRHSPPAYRRLSPAISCLLTPSKRNSRQASMDKTNHRGHLKLETNHFENRCSGSGIFAES